jgi:hypothetical protein
MAAPSQPRLDHLAIPCFEAEATLRFCPACAASDL